MPYTPSRSSSVIVAKPLTLDKNMNLFTRLLNAGITEQLTAYDRRQTKVFNSCNLAGMLDCTLKAGLSFVRFPLTIIRGFVLFVNALPLLICGSMLICMFLQFFQTAIVISFLCFPAALVVMVWLTGDRGIGKSIFFSIFSLSSFFLHNRWHIILAFCWVTSCIIAVHFSLRSFLPRPFVQDLKAEYWRSSIIVSGWCSFSWPCISVNTRCGSLKNRSGKKKGGN